MMERYILDDTGRPVLERDFTRWATWMEAAATDNRRRVAWTEVGVHQVSTVFLGIDHSFGEHVPAVLWETMTFGPEPWQDQQWRYTSREAALAEHDQIAEHIRRGGTPEDLS